MVLITKIKMTIPNVLILSKKEQFIMILSNKHPIELDALGKYVDTCFKKRSNISMAITVQL